jgi:hypothetical protein
MMNTYEIVVEQESVLKTYEINAANVDEAYNRIYEQLTKQHVSFNIVNLTKRDTGTNYSIAEAV